MKRKSFVVLGGCGAIGKVAVRDLLETAPRALVTIADYNLSAAGSLARSFKSRRVKAVFADAGKPATLARVLKGHDVVLNCTQHHFNLRVMEAALRAKVHYLDLGGLFYWTREQMKLHARFQRAGLTAILGAGCAPGITNVLTRLGADLLDRVDSVRIRVGTVDFAEKPEGFVFPYSAQTIVEEMTLTPWVFRGGRFVEIKPRSRWEKVTFPRPVGAQWTICTRHSEVATIPLSFKLKACDFHVSFDRAFVKELVKRLEAGQTVKDFQKLPASRGKPDDYEIARVVVAGVVEGGVRGRRPRLQKRVVTIDCHAKARPAWHASAGDIDTGCPPSIVAQLIAEGAITECGVLAPEAAIPAERFVAELVRRGMTVNVRVGNS